MVVFPKWVVNVNVSIFCRKGTERLRKVRCVDLGDRIK